MEKPPAACALEWSVELEKGLRSKRPGQPVEVIERIGSKLLKWSKESLMPMSGSKIYGLVPGEEKSFANTIILRLADAFKSGDNCIRACILKVFLLQLSQIKEKGRNYDGLLSKQRLPNYFELLKKVKSVFDTGDAKARALSLRLFGCWAPLTCDNAGVRYILLSSLRSGHALEVRASLFASGCLCRLSDDFACIVMGILVDIIRSGTSTASIMLAAAHAFGELQSSLLIINRAFWMGKKLVLDARKGDYIAEMLFSLSKLAVKSPTLIPEQVEVLLLFLSEEYTCTSMALKSIYFILHHGFFHFLISRKVFSTLFYKIDDPDIPLDQQCVALQTLCKLFSNQTKVCQWSIPEFPTLVMIVGNASKSLCSTKKCLALQLLVDISYNAKFLRKGSYTFTEQISSEHASFQSQVSTEDLSVLVNDAVLFARHVILILIDQIASMTKSIHIDAERGTIFLKDARFSDTVDTLRQKCSIFIKHVLRLVVEYPVLGLMALHRFSNLIEDLVHLFSTFNREAPNYCSDVSERRTNTVMVSKFPESLEHARAKCAEYVSAAILYICYFVMACLNVLDENALVSDEVCAVLKLLIGCLQSIEFCDSDACEMLSFHMHSYVIAHRHWIKDNTMQTIGKTKVDEILDLSEDESWVHLESFALGFARRMMDRRKHWLVYRCGKYSSCEGLWFSAAYAFRRLIDKAKSDSCRQWLKCLTLLAGAESEIQLLLYPYLGIKLISDVCSDSGRLKSCAGAKKEGTKDYDGGPVFLHDKGEKLSKVYRRICSSLEILTDIGTLTGAFWFQNWFLKLRGKVLQILLDVIRHLDTHFDKRKAGRDGHGEQNLGIFPSISRLDINYLTSQFSSSAFRLNKLAREYDFLASFLDMDIRSSRILSRLALSCSLLAFCAAFPLYLSSLCGQQSVMGDSGCFRKSNSSLFLDDLAGRLFYIYGASVLDLEKYVPCGGKLRGYLRCGKQVSGFSSLDRCLVLVSRCAISGFCHSKSKQVAKGSENEEDECQMFRMGLQLFYNILVKWMSVPFQTPRCFFRIRYCQGSEIVAHSVDVENLSKLDVLYGNQLCLNLCIQLRNISAEHCARICKIYCLLAAKSDEPALGNKDGEKEAFAGFQPFEETFCLHELLLVYLANETNKSDKAQSFPLNEADLVTTYVCTELNQQGQGFATCLLDVSTFPTGKYKVKWHSCCVDKDYNIWSMPVLSDSVCFTVREPSAT